MPLRLRVKQGFRGRVVSARADGEPAGGSGLKWNTKIGADGAWRVQNFGVLARAVVDIY